MDAVLTLIAATPDLAFPAIAAAVAAKVGAAAPVWLAEQQACDLFVADEPAAVERAARGIVGGAPIDVVCQPSAGRKKQLLVADLEATIIENEMLEELADGIGRRAEIAEITRRAMNGEIDFVAAVETRVALLAGLPQSALADAADRIRLTSGAAALVATMRAHGAYTVLVSGGFDVFAEPVGKSLGFDRIVANRLALEDGRVRGIVPAPIVTGQQKYKALLTATAERRIPPELTLAVGDGANDSAMLAAAGLGIAYHAKPAVAAAARWRVDHADLHALLYAQGYAQAEFVPPPRNQSLSPPPQAGEG